jgi:hypothetical protein
VHRTDNYEKALSNCLWTRVAGSVPSYRLSQSISHSSASRGAIIQARPTFSAGIVPSRHSLDRWLLLTGRPPRLAASTSTAMVYGSFLCSSTILSPTCIIPIMGRKSSDQKLPALLPQLGLSVRCACEEQSPAPSLKPGAVCRTCLYFRLRYNSVKHGAVDQPLLGRSRCLNLCARISTLPWRQPTLRAGSL